MHLRRAAMAGASPRPTAAAMFSGESVNRPYGMRWQKSARHGCTIIITFPVFRRSLPRKRYRAYACGFRVRPGDSKGGHIGVSPFGVFFFCHFFLHKQKEMARISPEFSSKKRAALRVRVYPSSVICLRKCHLPRGEGYKRRGVVTPPYDKAAILNFRTP